LHKYPLDNPLLVNPKINVREISWIHGIPRLTISDIKEFSLSSVSY